MSFGFVDKGVVVINKARDEDEKRNYAEAYQLYIQGCQYFCTALKYEKNEKAKQIIREKTDQYIQRAEQLKDYLEAKKASSKVSEISASKNGNQSVKVSVIKTTTDIYSNEKVEQKLEESLEDYFDKSIVGQTFAVRSVISAVHRREEGWNDENKPMVWLFLGPSGVGKTELAKALATALFAPKGASKDMASPHFIRIDMSEYQDKSSASKFLGAAPGYIGYSEGGQLTEKLRDCSGNAIVLLDEVEKAHPDVLTVMLQVFDEGRITDSKGQTINFDVLFVETSNLGSADIAKMFADDKSEPSEDGIVAIVEPILRAHFKRDELIGRINEILPFIPFTNRDIDKIVNLQLTKWAITANEKHNIKLQWTQELIASIRESYNPNYGVRSIRNFIDKKVVNELARASREGRIIPGCDAIVTVEDGQISVQQFHKQEMNNGNRKVEAHTTTVEKTSNYTVLRETLVA